MEKFIYGLVGKAGAGKDTVAQAIYETNPLGFTVDSFAHPIRMATQHFQLPIFDRESKERVKTVEVSVPELSNVLGIYSNMDDMTSMKVASATVAAFKRMGMLRSVKNRLYVTASPRTFAQILGTEGGRSVNENLWASLAVSKALEVWRTKGIKTVITDVRFLNEALLVDSLIAVIRPDNPHEINSTHPSEVFTSQLINGDVPALIQRRVITTVLNDFPDVKSLNQYVRNHPTLGSL